MNGGNPVGVNARVGICASAACVTGATQSWFDALQVLSVVGVDADRASPAHSQRHLALELRPLIIKSFGCDGPRWDNVIAAAGASHDPIVAALCNAVGLETVLWVEAMASDIMAAAFAADVIGGVGGVELIAFDVTPGATVRFATPLGRQALQRAIASFEDNGVTPYFIVQTRAQDTVLRDCGATVIVDPPPTPQPLRAPPLETPRTAAMDLQALLKDRDEVAVANAVLAFLAERATGLGHLRVEGTSQDMARATPYLEDLVKSGLGLTLHISEGNGASGLGLGALRASTALRLAFGDDFRDGARSFDDWPLQRDVRASATPAAWLHAVVGSLYDGLGDGLKDIELNGRFARLDIRP